MAASLHEILMPQVILDVVSKIRAGTGPLGRWLGFHPNRYDQETVSLSGPNTYSGPTRYAMFRLDNNVRTVMQARAPNTGPATVPQNPIGQTPVTCGRFHEKVPLAYEDLGNLSPVMGPNAQVDTAGQDYVSRQTLHLAQKANHTVELMAAGMMRGGYYLKLLSADRLYPVLTQPTSGNYITISSNIPAGNKNQLDPLGTGTSIIQTPWNNPAAPIIRNLLAIKSAYAGLSGYPMTDVWINSLTWGNIIMNNEVRQTAGTSETPFAQFERVEEKTPYDNLPVNDYVCMLRGDPTIRFHITDFVLTTGGDIDPINTGASNSMAVAEKLVPDNMAIFSTEPQPLWTKLYLGGEYVVENPGANPTLRSGYYFWHERSTQPAMLELIGLLNAVPLLYNPLVVMPANVVF